MTRKRHRRRAIAAPSRVRLGAIARRLLRDEAFCRSVDRRVAACGELVERLPRSSRDIALVLRRAPHRLSREVQFSLLNLLDDPCSARSDIRRLEPAVVELLHEIDSEVAFVWMVLGCLLGGGWHEAGDAALRRELEAILCEALRSAPHAAGRSGALHGIEHALERVSLARGKALLELVLESARNDRAESLRTRARMILQLGRWWGSKERPELKRHARRLGRQLESRSA